TVFTKSRHTDPPIRSSSSSCADNMTPSGYRSNVAARSRFSPVLCSLPVSGTIRIIDMTEHNVGWQSLEPTRVEEALGIERGRYALDHPRSQALHDKAADVLMAGVPMTWMMKWPGGFPLFLDSGQGNRL